MKKTILNKRYIFFVLLFSLLVIIAILALKEKEMVGLSITISSVGVILILGYSFIIPSGYAFSLQGITVRYCFGLKTFLCWKDIKYIEDHYTGGKGLPWWRSYEVAYFKTKISFHERAYIPKNKKTTEIINKYYHQTIEKYG